MYGGPQDFGIIAHPYPLHQKAEAGDLVGVQKFLKDLSYDVNTQDSQKQTALHLAVINGHVEVAGYLIKKHHARVDIANAAGKTVTELIQTSNREDFRALLQHPARCYIS